MKDSGVEWIGQIPEDWRTIRLKYLFIDRTGGAWGDEAKDNDGDIVCIRVADFDFGTQTIKDGNKTLRNYEQKTIERLKLEEHDLLIEKSGGGEKTPVGRTIIATGCRGFLFANFIDRLRIRSEHSPKYIAYFFRSLYYNGATNPYIKQTTGIQNLDIENLLRETIFVPTCAIQQRIADFLDAKCEKIDSLIANQQAQIEKLKEYKQAVITETVTKGLDKTAPMKDSGVDLLGDIPKDWGVNRVKFISTYNDEAISDKTDPNAVIDYVDIGSVSFEKGIEKIEKFSFKIAPSRAKRITRKGDIIISTVRTYLKAITMVDVEGLIVSTGFCVLRPRNMLNKYIEYFCKSNFFTDNVTRYSVGISYPAINASDLVGFVVCQPLLTEQKQIVEYLDKKCADIDSLISIKQQKIEKLKEYKKSLTYEYITGKKDVV